MTWNPQVLGNQLDNATRLINHIFHASHDSFLGNWRRRYDVNQIAFLDFHIAVTANWHLTQAIDRLTHPASLQDDQLMVFKLRHFLGLDQKAFVHQGQLLEADSRTNDVFNIKACQNHSAASLCSCIKDLLDTRQVAGNRCNNHTAIPVSNRIFDFLADLALTSHLNSAVGIGWITEQGQNTLAANLSQTAKVCRIGWAGRLVKLEITCINDTAFSGLDDNSQTLRNRVSRPEEGNHCFAKFNLSILINHMEIVEFLNCIVIFNKKLGQLNRQFWSKNRHLSICQKIRQSTNRIRVPVCQKDTRNPLLVFKQIIHVGNDIIHTQLLIFWVLQPNIQYKNGIIHFSNVEIFTIFTYAAQSNQFNIALAHFFSYSIFRISLLSKILYFITNGPWLAKSNYSLANLRFAYLSYYSIFSTFFQSQACLLSTLYHKKRPLALLG